MTKQRFYKSATINYMIERRIRHPQHHFSYPTSASKHYSIIFSVVAFIIICLLLSFNFLTRSQPLDINQISINNLIQDSFFTLTRLTISYVLSLLVALPLALLAVSSPHFEKILLPFFDILESIPALAFFPFIVLIFIKLNMTEGAAIFILFMAMLWNIVFSVIGGLKSVPKEIGEASQIFRASGFKKLFFVTIPAVFPYLVTGSMLAWAQGWNILIVAEVLHNYIPGGAPTQDLKGLGSLLVSSSFNSNNTAFMVGLTIMVLLIATMNYFIWQKLLHYGQRFRFE